MKDIETIRTSFENAYDEFLEPIFLFLAARLNNRERAKELAQETFMRAWKYMVDGNTIDNMRPFLYTTAYNLFKNELRAKRESVSLEFLQESRGYDPGDAALPLDHVLEQRMLIERITELPESYREVLTLRYIDGFAVKDIALMRGETQVAISVKIHRGIAKLRTAYVTKRKAQTA
ncbi:MAG: sigma-70 family RNA polymerase sigma factor [Candidatus Paceibacterota bacterium]